MLILGIILLLVGGGLFYGHISTKKKLFELRTTEKQDIGFLVEMQQDIAAELGGGSFSEDTALVGAISCDAPLTSPLAQKPCVYYTMSVTQEVEEQVWDSNAGEHRPQKRSESLQSSAEGTIFTLTDDTGSIKVDPEGANFKKGLVKSMDKFEVAGSNQLVVGGFSFQPMPLNDPQKRLLGYRFTESVMPTGVTVTAIGAVEDPMGEAILRKSKAKGLTISTQSQEELIESTKKTAAGLRIAAIVCAVAGVVFAILGAVT